MRGVKTHRSRGSLDGSDPVEDVVPIGERADARVRLGLWVGEEGVGGTKLCQGLSGREGRGKNLKETHWTSWGGRGRFPRESGVTSAGNFSETLAGCAGTRAGRTIRPMSSLCNLRVGRNHKRKRAVSGQIKNPSWCRTPHVARVQRFRASVRTSWQPTRYQTPRCPRRRLYRRPGRWQSPPWRWCSSRPRLAKSSSLGNSRNRISSGRCR